jgi:acid stress-induced BolA-like protein IbaG/YrbA
MDATTLKTLIEAAIPNAQVQVSSEDNVHFEMVVLSDAFNGLNRVKRQQLVYSAINDYIASGELHALAMKTLTPEEAAR